MATDEKNTSAKKSAEPTIYGITCDWARLDYTVTGLETVASTSDWAKANYKFSEEGVEGLQHWVVAADQSAGRGRGDNTWTSPKPGSALLATLIFQADRARQPIFTPLLGLGLLRALEETFTSANKSGMLFSLKAPNDIYLGKNKLAGILVESTAQADKYTYFVGIGLNVLGRPDALSAASISDLGATREQIFDLWPKFLLRLTEHWETAFAKSVFPILTLDDRQALCSALNQYAELPEKIVEVLPRGDLRLASHVVSWRDL